MPAAPDWRSAALLSYGFRPFFLGAAACGALAAPFWLLLLLGWGRVPSPLAPSVWHGHEMLFGYAAAALAGFLLTASPSWSRRPPIRGAPLALLAGLWLAGRIAIWGGEGLPALAALVDLAFLPALVVAISPALQNAARPNLVFLPLLTCLFAANLGVHLDALDLVPGIGFLALRLALDLLALLIGLIGGRVVPAFTANALRSETKPRPFSTIDRLALASLAAVLLADLTAPPWVTGSVALVAAGLQLARMRGWHSRRTFDQPIVWVLHLGYAWLAAGLAWKGLVELTAVAAAPAALHGLGIGAVGTMTLAVMSRAALGHTGRPLIAPRPIALAYLMPSLAALSRLAAPLMPSLEQPLLILSALAWSAGLALFLVVFTPILLRPRVDS